MATQQRKSTHADTDVIFTSLGIEVSTTSRSEHSTMSAILTTFQDATAPSVSDDVTDSLDAMLNDTTTGFNTTTDYSNLADPILPETFMAVYFSIRVLIALLSVGGNGLTIVAIIKFEVLQNTTNLMVANLAVADMLTGLLVPAVIAQHLLRELPVYVPLCVVEKAFSLISLRANLVFILWIAVDRYFYIAHPLKYVLWMTPKRTFAVVFLTWLYIVADSSLVMAFANVFKMGGTCKLSLVVNSKVYTRYLLPLVYICFPLTIACYVAIARIAIKQNRAVAALNQPVDTIEASISQHQKKIAKMMFTVLVSHIVSWIPQVCLAVVIQNTKTLVTLAMELVTTTIYFSNSFLNPFIYAWKSKEFRGSFKKLLGLPNNETPIHQ